MTVWTKTVTLVGGPLDGRKFSAAPGATMIHIPVPVDPTYVAGLEEALSEFKHDPVAVYEVNMDNTATYLRTE